MKIPSPLLGAVALTFAIAGCVLPQAVQIGATEAQVLAARGAPTNRYLLDDGQLLEYNHGPFGQQTYMARLNANGRLISFEQVLTDRKFAEIKPNASTTTDVLHTVGAPSERMHFPLSQLEAWSYPYKENGIWNSVMHVYVDRAGIVRKMDKTPDMRFAPHRRDLFGGFGHWQ